MSKQIKTPDGIVHSFPDDATDAEIGNALNSGPMPKQATAPPAAATRGMTPPSTMQEPSQPAAGEMSNEAWAALPTGEKARQALQWGGKVIAGMTGMGGAGREAVDNPKTTLTLAAVGPAVKQIGALAPRAAEGVRRIGGISKIRAGANIQAAEQAAGDVPLNVEKVGAEGLRAVELQQAGGRMPRVVSQLMQRITSPGAAELTFKEARDFYSNLSRLSANEFGSVNPTMQRQLGAMRAALHDSLVGAADTVGKGEQYAKGMSEYAKASRAAARWNDAKPGLKKALWAALGTAGLTPVAKKIWDAVP